MQLPRLAAIITLALASLATADPIVERQAEPTVRPGPRDVAAADEGHFHAARQAAPTIAPAIEDRDQRGPAGLERLVERQTIRVEERARIANFQAAPTGAAKRAEEDDLVARQTFRWKDSKRHLPGGVA